MVIIWKVSINYLAQYLLGRQEEKDETKDNDRTRKTVVR